METNGYMLLGFAVIFGTLLVHLASLAWRDKNLRRDLIMLEGLVNSESKKNKKPGKKSRR
jgi:hypothetical protein